MITRTANGMVMTTCARKMLTMLIRMPNLLNRMRNPSPSMTSGMSTGS